MSDAIQFNINDYAGKRYAMICESKYEAETFLGYLDSIGRTWVNGSSYISHTNFPSKSHKQRIAYFFDEGTYSTTESMRSAIQDGRVIYYKDFRWNNWIEDITPSDMEELNSFLEQFEVK